jgi:hypothetical protein
LGSFQGDSTSGQVTVKVDEVTSEDLEAAMHDLDLEILDIRET